MDNRQIWNGQTRKTRVRSLPKDYWGKIQPCSIFTLSWVSIDMANQLNTWLSRNSCRSCTLTRGIPDLVYGTITTKRKEIHRLTLHSPQVQHRSSRPKHSSWWKMWLPRSLKTTEHRIWGTAIFFTVQTLLTSLALQAIRSIQVI